MYSVAYEPATVDPIIVSDPSCAPTLDIPAFPHLVPDNVPPVTTFKGGIQILGVGSKHTKAYQWFPGETEWQGPYSGGLNRMASAVSFGDNNEQVFTIGNLQTSGFGDNKVFHYNGTKWFRDCEVIPHKTFTHALLYHNEDLFVFGGVTQDGVQSAEVYKFDMATKGWSRLEDMPSGGGSYPSCGKATYDGRPSVLCTGTKENPSNDMEIFDLEDETWTTKPDFLTSANPPTYGSVVFSRGNKLYRVRGFHTDDSPTNSYDVLDLDTMTWAPPVTLEPSDVAKNQLVVIDTEE